MGQTESENASENEREVACQSGAQKKTIDDASKKNGLNNEASAW